MELIFIGAMFAALFVVNAFATFKVLRDECSERPQKIAQIVLVWLLPALGALIVLAVHRAPQEPSRQYYQPADVGENFCRDAATGKRLLEAIDD